MTPSTLHIPARRYANPIVAVIGFLVVLALASLLLSVLLKKPSQFDFNDCSEMGLPPKDGRTRVKSVYSDPANSESAPVEGISLRKRLESAQGRNLYNVYARDIDFTKPVGVVYRLHGDGAEEYYEPNGYISCIAAVAASLNKILVVPLSPDRRGEVTWWENMSRNARFLKDLHAAITSEYKFEATNTWWTGYSGGAELLTYELLAEQPGLLGRGALMLGGGGANAEVETVASAEQKASLKLVWATGENDTGSDPRSPFDAKSAAIDGSTRFKELGFQNVQLQILGGKNHFDLPELSLLEEFLAG